MKSALTTLLLALLAGCAHEVQVVTVDPAKKCEPAPALLEGCEGAVLLGADISYGALLDSYLVDRQRLRACASRRDDLAKALETCNAAIDRHNAELAERLKASPAK